MAFSVRVFAAMACLKHVLISKMIDIRLKFMYMYEFLQTRELSHCATETKDLNDAHQNYSIFKIDSFSMCFQTIVTQQT